MIEAFAFLFAPLAGLVLGSLVTTAGLRAARGEQGLTGRSRCDHCGVGLGYADTIPVISFLLRRGACGACGGRIDPVHLAGELAGLAIGVMALALRAPMAGLAWTFLGLGLLGGAAFGLGISRGRR